MSTIHELAQELLEALRPGCEKISTAGSIRRGKAMPKDIEIVAVPRYRHSSASDMFGNPLDVIVIDELAELVESITASNQTPWIMDDRLRRNGPKYKRLAHAYEQVACDLFIVQPETWGAQMVIRTGPADFSHMLVTRALRLGMKQEGGLLWRTHRDGTKTVIPTPEEIDYLKALGLPWIEPEMRGKVPA